MYSFCLFVNSHISYNINEYGDVVPNKKGNRVLAQMRELMLVYFPDDILTDWRRQPSLSKDVVLEILHQEFPNPPRYCFNKLKMRYRMNHTLKSRQGTARTTVNTESPDYHRMTGDGFWTSAKLCQVGGINNENPIAYN